MVGSIKLLIAALGVSQFGGVMGERRIEKKREQLRRSLRKGNVLPDAEVESERKMQFIAFTSEDAITSSHEDDHDPGYDDFFGPPQEIMEAVPQQDDDFFKYTSSGMEVDWDSAVQHRHGHSHDDDHTAADHQTYVTKSAKSSKLVGNIASNPKVEKAAKVGKMMWDETPITVPKSSKKKDLKSLKAQISIKGAKGAFVNDARPSSYYDGRVDDHRHENDHDHDQDQDHTHESEDSFLSGAISSGNMVYGDVFQTPIEVHRNDDYFDDPGSRSTPLQVGMDQVQARASFPSEGISGRHENNFDDDFFTADARLVFRPRPAVTLAASVFSVNPESLIAPVVPDGTGDTFSLGTEYLFNEVMTDAQNINTQLAPVDVDGENVLFIIALDGFCNRIGPADDNSVQGYCFFTYTFIDPSTQLNSGSITAQGIIVNASVPGQLTITGGTGTMTGATGLVEILPASVNNDMNPPELVAPIAGSDPFSGVAGWAHFFEFDVDVLFFLPELYAR